MTSSSWWLWWPKGCSYAMNMFKADYAADEKGIMPVRTNVSTSLLGVSSGVAH
jgi:hypothetical protein